MVKLESFKDLSKKQDHLLTKGFYVGSISLLTLKINRDNYRFHGRLGENEPGASFPLFLSAWQQYKVDTWGVKLKRGNDGVFNLGVKLYPKKFSQITAKFQYRQEKGSTLPSLTVNFANPNVKVTTEVTQGSLHTNLTAGTPTYGAGFEAFADFEHAKVSLSNVAAWWAEKGSRFVVKHETVDSNPFAVGKFEIGMFRKINVDTKMAAKVKCNWVDKATEIHLAGEYKQNPESVWKTKINSFGAIGAAWKKVFSPSISTVISAETSLDSLFGHSFQDIKYGFRLNLTQ